MDNPTVKQEIVFNSTVYEGKTLYDWIEYFKLSFREISGNEITTFLDKSSEAYYLLSKIKPYSEYLERSLKRTYDIEKTRIIKDISEDKSKRVPSSEVLDSLIKTNLKSKYDELNVCLMVLSVFEVIVKEYDSISYMVNKKFM